MPDLDYLSELPSDGFAGTLIARVWTTAEQSGSLAGPSPALVTEEGVFDLSRVAPTCAELLERMTRECEARITLINGQIEK